MAQPLRLEYEPKRNWQGQLRAAFMKLFQTVSSRRFIVRFLSVAAILLTAGYLSDRLSLGSCERRTAIAIAKDEFGGRPFHAGRYNEAEIRAIFTTAGIQTLSFVAGQAGLPCAGITHARSVAPFVVDIEYGCTFGPLDGHGGIRRYFCLFGIPILIGDQMTWVC
jgi:hypothetical protein